MNGRKINNQVMVYIYMKMELIIEECLKMDKEMVKVHIMTRKGKKLKEFGEMI